MIFADTNTPEWREAYLITGDMPTSWPFITPGMLPMSIKILAIFLCFSVWTGLTPAGVSGGQQPETTKAYKVKAAFLLNFAKFINWPADPAGGGTDSFRICVLGSNPFGSSLSALNSRSIGNKKIELHYTDTLRQDEDCQLIFISTSQKDNLDTILKELGTHPVAMVSDIEGFARAGGTIEFVSQENKLTFNINLQRARTQGLNIHSALLNLASEVIQ